MINYVDMTGDRVARSKTKYESACTPLTQFNDSNFYSHTSIKNGMLTI